MSGKRKYIRLGKPIWLLGIIVSILMMLFGFFFIGLLLEEASPIGIAFMSFWSLIVLVMLIYFIYGYRHAEDEKGLIQIDEED